jgi:hypothetical protein
MPIESTDREAPATVRQVPLIVAFFAFSGGLLAYLFTPALPAGDGAAYMDQVLDGIWTARTVHLGYLIQLAPLARLAGDAGGALLSCLWATVALAAALDAGRSLTGSWRMGLVAPAALMGMSLFWTHALFPEVYGPAAAAVLLSAALRLRGQAVAAGVVAGVAAAMHPGALIWLPTLALMRQRWVRFLIPAVLLPAALSLVAPGDYWTGERGVLAVVDWPRPWRATQRVYRLAIEAAPVVAALMLIALADRKARRRVALPLLPGLVLVVLTDWRDDVPAALPGLYLAALLAPTGLTLLRSRLPRRKVVTGVAMVALACQIGEATTRHDRARRRVEREVAAIEALLGVDPAPQPWGSWGERARFQHYLGTTAGVEHVALPPGVPFPAGACPTQRAAPVGAGQVFLCDGTPASPVPGGLQP